MVSGQSSVSSYQYDDANRLTSVNGVLYTWDDNGNLLNDGVNTYTYDSANRLSSSNGPSTTVTYRYNGLGDRLEETTNGQTTIFTMDLNSGLTQALSDGINTHLYGNGRIAQKQGSATEYFLGDALGSVRQMADASAQITYARAYDPYGVVSMTSGSSQTSYGYTAEYTGDYNELLYLRARYYAIRIGRFLTKDTWEGVVNKPLSFNRWNYVEGNPINLTDPSGKFPIPGEHGYDRSFPVTGSFSIDRDSLHGCTGILYKPPCYEWKWVEMEVDDYFFPFSLTKVKIIVPQLVPCEHTQSSHKDSSLRDGYCKALERDYFSILRQVRSVTQKIVALQKELENTKEPERREDIIKEIDDSSKELVKLIKEADRIRNYAKNIGCNVLGWP